MIQDLIARLKDPSESVREEAEKELRELSNSGTASLADAAALIEGATGEFPKPKYEWQDPAAPMLWAARDIARDKDPSKLLPVIERAFGRMSTGARQGAMQILVMAASPEAAAMYVRFIERYGDQLEVGMMPEFEASAGPEVGERLFPALIPLARNRELAYPIMHSLLTFRSAELVPPDVAKEFHGSLAMVLQGELEQARALQRPSGKGWMYDDPYAGHRDLIGLMFDLAGVLSSQRLMRVVESAGDLMDPRLRRFRAVTLLRAGRDVPRGELEWIARSARDRYWLFEQLHQLGMAERLPESCLDQAKLAEGNMVDWLCFGTELGREPDEIELIHVETRNRSEANLLVRWMAKRKPVEYYFFKYRVTEEHWSKENGWCVGMAGGYAKEEQPTTRHDGGTFSKFEPFESKSLREHVEDYLR